MRCECCNRILHRVTGTRKLPDGSAVEETFCNTCRNEVNKILHDATFTTNANYSIEYQFEGIVDQLMIYGSVTPPKNSVY